VNLEGVAYPILPSFIDVLFIENGNEVTENIENGNNVTGNKLNKLIENMNAYTTKIEFGDVKDKPRVNTQKPDADVDDRSWYRFIKMLAKFYGKPKPRWAGKIVIICHICHNLSICLILFSFISQCHIDVT